MQTLDTQPARLPVRTKRAPRSAGAHSRVRSAIDLELIVPAFNEERRLERTLDAVVAEVRSLPQLSPRIVVVDNGSSDRTAEIVDCFLAAQRRKGAAASVDVIGCSRPGKGAAVRRGMLSSGASFVGFCDADLATPARDIVRAVEALRGGYDVVFGSRRCSGASYVTAQPPLRRAASLAFRMSARRLAGSITDTQCGFKFFTAAAAHAIFAKTSSSGFSFDLEIAALARLLDFRVAELPVAWSDQAGSTLKPLRDGPRIAGELHALLKRYPTLPTADQIVVLP